MLSRSQIKSKAKSLIPQNYWPMVGSALILAIATGSQEFSTSSGNGVYSGSGNNGILANGDSSIPAGMGWTLFLALMIVIGIRLFLLLPLEYGSRSWFHHVTRGDQKGRVASAFERGTYDRAIRILFRRDLFISLWTCVFVIPGIVKSYAWYFVPYLAEDHPELSSKEILRLSEKMTEGRKMDLFIFDLSFILWGIAGALTFGLGDIFYINPYKAMSHALMYEEFVNEGLDPLHQPEVVDAQYTEY